MCGRKRKASELVKNWQGAYRCPEHNEPRHPQDFAKGIQEHPEVAWSQAPSDVFIIGDLLLTENSNLLFGHLVYIMTESGYPITTET
jgi:hypothetical protein